MDSNKTKERDKLARRLAELVNEYESYRLAGRLTQFSRKAYEELVSKARELLRLYEEDNHE